MKKSGLFISGLMLALWGPVGFAEPVAMVMDVKGKVELQTGSKKSAVSMLAEIEPESRISLEKDGQMVVMYLQSGEEYVFTGAGQFKIGAAAPVVVSGTAPQKRSAALGKVANAPKIKPGGLAQAAVVMRSVNQEQQIRLLSLADTVTLDLAPEFRWEGVRQGAKYAFELQNEYGEAVWDTTVDDTSVILPPSVRLKEGRKYVWKVSTTENGKPLVSQGQFTIAPLDIRIQVEALRPNPQAPLSDQVAFAVWLRQVEFRDEAKKYWKVLSAERKSDETLRALARE